MGSKTSVEVTVKAAKEIASHNPELLSGKVITAIGTIVRSICVMGYYAK